MPKKIKIDKPFKLGKKKFTNKTDAIVEYEVYHINVGKQVFQVCNQHGSVIGELIVSAERLDINEAYGKYISLDNKPIQLVTTIALGQEQLIWGPVQFNFVFQCVHPELLDTHEVTLFVKRKKLLASFPFSSNNNQQGTAQEHYFLSNTGHLGKLAIEPTDKGFSLLADTKFTITITPKES